MSLKQNPINGKKVKGSQPLPGCDINEIGLQTKLQVKSMQTPFKIMKQAVAKCPSIELKVRGESVPSLLDSGSMVSLMQQDHFNQYFRLQLGPTEGSVADTHHLFNLRSASGGAIPLSRYVELDVEFLGLHMPRVRFLIIQNLNKVLDPDHRTRLPRIVGWNLVKKLTKSSSRSTTSMCLRTLNAWMELILYYFPSCVYITMLMWYQLW